MSEIRLSEKDISSIDSLKKIGGFRTAQRLMRRAIPEVCDLVWRGKLDLPTARRVSVFPADKQMAWVTRRLHKTFLYFALDHERCVMKVGVSLNPPKRVGGLRASCPGLLLVRMVPGSYKLESQLLAELSCYELGVGSEMFRCTIESRAIVMDFFNECEEKAQ